MSAIKHWWLVIRGSIIGTIVGIIPGVGGPTAVFVAYAHARQTSKDPESFGKGNIEGVIAPESANNAKDGGALIPTVAFGIPGSTVMAILLAALYMHGLEPGRALVMNNQTFLFSLVWLIVLGGILGSVIGLAGTTFLAKITNVSYKIVVPAIIVVSALGTIVYRNLFSDLMIAGFFGIVGYIMKKLEYPTSTLIIGFVLGNKIEKSLFVSTELYGASFLTRPLVVVMLVLLVFLLAWPTISKMRKKHKPGATPAA
jgi:putative tricarboxylic transport membrane protein